MSMQKPTQQTSKPWQTPGLPAPKGAALERFEPGRMEIAGPDYLTHDAPNVVKATTVQTDPAVTAIFLRFVLIFILALAILAGYFAYKASTELALTAFLLTFGILGFLSWRFTLVVASGNFAAEREIRAKWEHEERRMETAHAVYMRQLELQAARDRYLYKARVLELRREMEIEHMRLQAARTRRWPQFDDGQTIDAAAAPRLSGETGETVRGFVPARTSPVRAAILDWLLGDGEAPGIYGPDGAPNPDLVAADGRLVNHTIPWSSRGPLKGEGARREALGILQPGGAPALVTYTAEDKSWRLNLDAYPTAEAAQRMVGRY